MSGDALVWPATAGAVAVRLGYTVTDGIYLPAAEANGLTIGVHSGFASAYAGLPGAPGHRFLASIGPGQPYTVSGLAGGEVLSVQAASGFDYSVAAAPESPPPGDPTDPVDPPAGPGSSALVTWTCTGSPCPWGSSLSGHALAWPVELSPIANRHGYTVTAGVYLPAANANGLTVTLASGSATAYAGTPDAGSHRAIGTLMPGVPYEVTGIAAGEVVSVHSGSSFTFTLAPADPPPPTDPTDPPAGLPSSQPVAWNCTSQPCPWGSSVNAEAVVWPESAHPGTARFGYTVSAGVYLPAVNANGVTIMIGSGIASVYAGAPDATSHRVLATLGAGSSYTFENVTDGEVVSVQGSAAFTYTSTPPGTNAPVDPDEEGVIHSVPARWRCNVPECTSGDWVSEVIDWPSWAAYQDNARSGERSRSTFSPSGAPLYPYMGQWADGCEVTAVSGTVVIVEWQRGTDVWRETWLQPGEAHVIDLFAPEDGALIESFDNAPRFSVRLNNCTPQPLP